MGGRPASPYTPGGPPLKGAEETCHESHEGEARPVDVDRRWVRCRGSASSCGASANPPPSPLAVTWLQGFAAPGTPAKYDRVGVIKVGPSSAKNVLVLEPGTSAGSAYFVPLAKWIVSKISGWQVWSVERRENLLEDQSELNRYKEGKATSTQLFDYYLGYLKNPSITPHFQLIANSNVEFAKQWGMNVAVEDLHVVIDAAKKLGGRVVLGGHSLGGSVVTAYATWDFNGRAGADELAGLVYIDGGSSPTPMSTAVATRCSRSTSQRARPGWNSGDRRSLCRYLQCHRFGGRAPRPERPRHWVSPRGSCPLTSCHRSGSPTSPSTATH